MTSPGPDWAALYQKHRVAMYGVAARQLRGGNIVSQVEDVVQDAMVSLMSNPPKNVKNWEAMMVTAAKRKALDRLRSADYRHAGRELAEQDDQPADGNAIEVLEEAIDLKRKAGSAWDALSVLDERHRYVAWEYVAKERPRAEVAAELGVSPARVSQMAAQALEQLRKAMDR